MWQLYEDDRHAVDWLLDRESLSAAGPLMAPDGDFDRRLKSAETLLGTLENLPAAEPPMDLVGRTLRRIEEANGANQTTPMPTQTQPGLRPNA